MLRGTMQKTLRQCTDRNARTADNYARSTVPDPEMLVYPVNRLRLLEIQYGSHLRFKASMAMIRRDVQPSVLQAIFDIVYTGASSIPRSQFHSVGRTASAQIKTVEPRTTTQEILFETPNCWCIPRTGLGFWKFSTERNQDLKRVHG